MLKWASAFVLEDTADSRVVSPKLHSRSPPGVMAGAFSLLEEFEPGEPRDQCPPPLDTLGQEDGHLFYHLSQLDCVESTKRIASPPAPLDSVGSVVGLDFYHFS